MPTPAIRLCAAMLLITGCDARSGDPVENEADRSRDLHERIEISVHPDAVPAWSVGETSFILQSGDVTDGGAPYFVSVRAAIWLESGRFLVVDGPTSLHLFDGDGEFLTTFGRRGEGPGEFAYIGTISVVEGDTIFAYDGRLRTVNVFHPEVGLVRSRRIGMPDGTLGNADVFRAGSGWLHLASDLEGFDIIAALGALGPGQIRSLRETAVIHRLDEGGDPRQDDPGWDTRFPGGSTGLVDGMSVIQPLAARPVMSVRDDVVVFSSGDEFVITWTNSDLEVKRQVEWPAFATSFSVRELDSIRSRMEADGLDERSIEIMLSDALVPASRPSMQRLHIDASCRVWVTRFEPPLRSVLERHWFVLDESGHPLARLDAPALEGFRVLDARGDELLVTHLGGPVGEPVIEVVRARDAGVQARVEGQPCAWNHGPER